MRRITLTIEEDSTNQRVTASTSVDAINLLYQTHKINGITEMLLQMNDELNDKTGIEVKIHLLWNKFNALKQDKDILKEISKTETILSELQAEGKLRTIRIEDLPKMVEFNQAMAEINAEYESKNAHSEMEINQKDITFSDYIIQQRGKTGYLLALDEIMKSNSTIEEWFSRLYSEYKILFTK